MILSDFGRLAPIIGCHAAAPRAAHPEIGPVSSSDDFYTKIRAFHELGYTVRFPNLNSLHPRLSELLRCLECLLHKPVRAEGFWSRGDGKAPAHYDRDDIIVVQLKGRKRWFISRENSELPNPWKSNSSGPPRLGKHDVVEVGPGDMLYLPRGTIHCVEAVSESLHLSIGLVPLTVREALIATIDHLSDTDRTLREALTNPMSLSAPDHNIAEVCARIGLAASSLLGVCASNEFVETALQRRSSRAIADLPKLNGPKFLNEITPESELCHHPMAICHLDSNGKTIDFSLPSEHIYIHAGATAAVRFIADTPRFKVKEVPGLFDNEVRIALVRKLLASNFLTMAPT